jgi:signal transduction histidine kinase
VIGLTELDLLRSVASSSLGAADPDRLFEEIARIARLLVKADGGAVLLLAGEGEFLRVAGDDGLLREFTGRLLPVDGSVSGWAIRNDQAVRTDDLSTDPRNHPVEGVPPVRAAVVVPLRSRGRVIGTIGAYNRSDGSCFTDDDLHLLAALADQVTLGLDRAALLEEARRNEVALERKHQELLEATQLKDRILATISHELRTPLNAIIGFSDLLMDDPAISEGNRDYLDSIARNGRHLLSLINDLLDLSKLAAGRVSLNLASIDVRSVVDSAVADTESLRAIKAQRCTVETGQGPLLAVADQQRVHQVLLNLLSNASKFTGLGGSVSVSALASQVPLPVKGAAGPAVVVQDAIWIAVQDTGKGIRAEDLPKLFQPFGQLDPSSARVHAGTGLGLSLSKQLVELHGGAIGVESIVGQGARFWFALPVRGPG